MPMPKKRASKLRWELVTLNIARIHLEAIYKDPGLPNYIRVRLGDEVARLREVHREAGALLDEDQGVKD